MNSDFLTIVNRIDVFALFCTIDELAGITGMSRMGLYKAFARYGINYRQRRVEALKVSICRMIRFMPASSIGARLRMSTRTVRKYAHEGGFRFGNGGRRQVVDGKWKGEMP